MSIDVRLKSALSPTGTSPGGSPLPAPESSAMAPMAPITHDPGDGLPQSQIIDRLLLHSNYPKGSIASRRPRSGNVPNSTPHIFPSNLDTTLPLNHWQQKNQQSNVHPAWSFSDWLAWTVELTSSPRGFQYGWGARAAPNTDSPMDVVKRMYKMNLVHVLATSFSILCRDEGSPTKALRYLGVGGFYGERIVGEGLASLAFGYYLVSMIDLFFGYLTLFVHLLNFIHTDLVRLPEWIIRSCDTRTCVPMFNNPHKAPSLAHLWGKAWHQNFRQAFIICGGAPATKLAKAFGLGVQLQRLAGMAGCFVVSAALHEYAIHCIADSPPEPTHLFHDFPGSAIYFLLQPIGIVLEPFLVPYVPGGGVVWATIALDLSSFDAMAVFGRLDTGARTPTTTLGRWTACERVNPKSYPGNAIYRLSDMGGFHDTQALSDGIQEDALSKARNIITSEISAGESFNDSRQDPPFSQLPLAPPNNRVANGIYQRGSDQSTLSSMYSAKGSSSTLSIFSKPRSHHRGSSVNEARSERWQSTNNNLTTNEVVKPRYYGAYLARRGLLGCTRQLSSSSSDAARAPHPPITPLNPISPGQLQIDRPFPRRHSSIRRQSAHSLTYSFTASTYSPSNLSFPIAVSRPVSSMVFKETSDESENETCSYEDALSSISHCYDITPEGDELREGIADKPTLSSPSTPFSTPRMNDASPQAASTQKAPPRGIAIDQSPHNHCHTSSRGPEQSPSGTSNSFPAESDEHKHPTPQLRLVKGRKARSSPGFEIPGRYTSIYEDASCE
ncbi:hypothetical protein KEM48_010588 [Puccinia striiformis f. sp. tritici PST-130]|nr:hypothetical protein KEM48_010588 [Puccinia striiformis f. sp. tritici PST-130]